MKNKLQLEQMRLLDTELQAETFLPPPWTSSGSAQVRERVGVAQPVPPCDGRSIRLATFSLRGQQVRLSLRLM